MSKDQVIAAIIEDSGKFLVGKRSLSKRISPGYWAPICGRIEPNESKQQALVREVQEEVGLIIEPLYEVTDTPTTDGSAIIYWWRVRIISGSAILNNDEHSEIRWVDGSQLDQLTPHYAVDWQILKSIL